MHGTQVRQFVPKVGSFTHSDEVVDLASGVDTTDHRVVAQMALVAVGVVDEAGEFFPSVPPAAHRAGAG